MDFLAKLPLEKKHKVALQTIPRKCQFSLYQTKLTTKNLDVDVKYLNFYLKLVFHAYLLNEYLLRRKIPMAWGTTTDRVTAEINHFLYARETKHLTLKYLDTYLIPDG